MDDKQRLIQLEFFSKGIYPERFTDERTKAHDALIAYCDLGVNRSLEKLRQKLGKSEGYKRQLETWSSRYEWQRRAAEYDDTNVSLRAAITTEREAAIFENLANARYLLSDMLLNLAKDGQTKVIFLTKDGRKATLDAKVIHEILDTTSLEKGRVTDDEIDYLAARQREYELQAESLERHTEPQALTEP